MSGDRRGWALVAPCAAGAVVLVAVPAAVSLVFTLLSYDGLRAPEYVGLANLRHIAGESRVQDAVRTSLLVTALAVPLRVGGALALALLLHRRERVAAPARVATFVPVSTPDVASALVWLWLVNPVFGPLGAVARGFGFDAGPLLLDPMGARLVVVAIAAFALGEGFLVLLAARRELPDAVYDAARLEGAGAAAVFRRVTVPLLAPALSLLLVRDLVLAMQVTMIPTLLLTRGGPDGSTTTLPLLIFDEGFVALRFGEAASMALLLVVATAAVALVQHRLLRRFVGEWAR